RGSEPVKIPELDFAGATPPDPRPGAKQVRRDPNPLRHGLAVTARSVGPGHDLKLRFPRPVYYEPEGKKPAVDPTFLVTATGWNADEPLPRDDAGPRYTPPKPDDPKGGTLDVRRRGRFPIGVAVEADLPSDWKGTSKTVRLAVIGHGEVFTGATLKPAQERLFLQTANWLLGREDYLPRDAQP